MSPGWRRISEGLLCLGAAAFCVDALSSAGGLYGGGFRLPARGTRTVPAEELAFFSWYFAFGLAFALFFTAGLSRLGLGARLADGLGAAARWRGWPVLLPLVAGASSVCFRMLVLSGQAVTDDEEVYLFIARTLLEGRVTNPLPGDEPFFRMQFVVLNDRGWFGKYPIGHGLVLAVALATRLQSFLLPALGGVTALLTWRLGRRLLGPRRALWGLALVVLSPHFTWTFGTLLSQTTSCFALVAATAALARPRLTAGWTALAGLALGFGVLARPAPMALFVPVAMLHIWLRGGVPRAVGKRLGGVALVAAGGALGAAGVAVVNALQAGGPLETGYHAVHGTLGWFWEGLPGQVGQSVFGALLRENFWLLGWPASLLPVLFARPSKGRILLWGPLVAELAYRAAVPKTVVSTTGPVYLTEAVPFLALLAADGLARLQVLLGRLRRGPAAARTARATVAVAAVASTLAGWLLFVPVAGGAAARGAAARTLVADKLAEAGVERALVFTDQLVPATQALTWAYYPPVPSPRLDDPILYLRWPPGAGEEKLRELSRRRFPDRRAFGFIAGKEPRLFELDAAAP